MSHSKLLYEIHFAHALRISLVSNIVSGIAGILISIALNGGSWLVVWFPWVSGQEVHQDALLSFIVYYAGAFILTLLLEYSTNYTQLAIRYSRSTIALVTLITNAISYVLGSAVLYSYRFN